MVNNKPIFVDSNFFIALFNPADSLNKRSIAFADQLDKNSIPLATSNLVFLEVVTVLSMKRGKLVATEVGNFILSNPNIQVLQVDAEQQQRSWEIFTKVSNKNVSFVDCSNIALMQYANISIILTFDTTDAKHLKKHHKFSIYSLQK